MSIGQKGWILCSESYKANLDQHIHWIAFSLKLSQTQVVVTISLQL